MPTKPTSIFIITETPSQSAGPGSLEVQRVALDGRNPDQVIRESYQGQPAGTVFYVVDDAKVKAFTVGLSLREVDDVRLTENE